MARVISRILCAAAVLAALAFPCSALAAGLEGSFEIQDRFQALKDDIGGDKASNGAETRVGVLTSANPALDGSMVSFTGEVVGDVMSGGRDHKWVNVLGSDGACVGVWVDDEMASRVKNLGSYSTAGTILEVHGTYSVDCKDHQGELDVHAESIRVLDAGGAVSHFVDTKDVVWGMVLSGIGLALLLTFVVLRLRSDRQRFLQGEERRR